jgi:AraC-like DNA-binding protein
MDEIFLKKVFQLLEQNLGNSEFNSTSLAREIGLSRYHLNVKLKALTGLVTRDFIRNMRLKYAAKLIKRGHGNIAEIAYQVGFNNLSYFSKVFKETYGVLPSRFNEYE